MTGRKDEPMVQVWDAIEKKSREVPFSELVESDLEVSAQIDRDMATMSSEDWIKAAPVFDVPPEVMAEDKNRRRAIYLYHALRNRWPNDEDFDVHAPACIHLSLTRYKNLTDNEVALLFLRQHTPLPTDAEIDRAMEDMKRHEGEWGTIEEVFEMEGSKLQDPASLRRFCTLILVGMNYWGERETDHAIFLARIAAFARLGMNDAKDMSIQEMADFLDVLDEDREGNR